MILNKVTQEGNSIFIRSNPQTGIIALTSFADNASGEISSRYFNKSFRYSLNGITFTDWQPLTTDNILAITVTASAKFVIELQYERVPTGNQNLNVNTVNIGTTDATLTNSDIFNNSIFAQFFGSSDIDVLNWMINVLDKLFQRGLLPNYIDRYNDFDSPNDFIEFWGAVCKFFAYYVIYARKYQKFYENEELLREYINERGLTTSRHNTLQQLYLLMSKYNREISKRGTIRIVDKKSGALAFGGDYNNDFNDDFSTGTTGSSNNLFSGELLRLINYLPYDEFLFNPNLPQFAGWNISNSSPSYRSSTINNNLNKFYEPESEPTDITKYPITGDVTIGTDAGRNVLKIGYNSGINGGVNSLIPVDEYMDYEFSFFIKKTDGDNLTVGLTAYDQYGNALNLVSRTDNTPSNNFLSNKNLSRSDKYLYLRFFLYNKLKPLYAHDGLNLKMVDNIHFITPVIFISNGNASIYNVRFTPMVLPYSKGFVQVNNFVDCIAKNNNQQLNISEVEKFTKKYLLPYSSHLKLTESEKMGDYTLEEYIPPITAPSLATVTTATPTNVQADHATMGGTVTADGGSSISERGIVWSVAANPTIDDNRNPMGLGKGSFSGLVSNLPPASTIYIRAYAINAAGVAYGSDVSLQTPVMVTSILVSNSNPSNASTLHFSVLLSTAVTGLTVDNFALAITGGITGASITGISGSGNSYIVTVDTGAGNGSIGLNLITDTGLNYQLGNLPFTGQVYLIDKTAPTTTINTYPSDSTSTTAAFTFSAVDVGGSGLAGYLVSLDGSAFVQANSPVTYTNLANGSHTFQVKAYDNAGNVGSPAVYTWGVNELVLQPFDYLVVRFTWAQGAGVDLDIVTGFVNTGVAAVDCRFDTTTGTQNKWIGYGNNNVLPDTGTIDNSYAFWALDNVSAAGTEAVLVSFNKLIRDYAGAIANRYLTFNLNTVWYNSVNSGLIAINLVTYLGGSMSKVGTDIVNTGGTLVDNVTLSNVLVSLVSQQHNYPNSEQVGYVTYDTQTKTATLTSN